jgi:diketogulonate reductase-like aldo/keto reductase
MLLPHNFGSHVLPMNTLAATLHNGVQIPLLGLGVYQIRPGRSTRNAVAWALEAGYRHIDTAAAYGNETGVGEAIRESGVPREQVFVTTKLWNDDHGYDDTLAAIDSSLDRLGFDYVDLYLVHWPVPELRLATWRAMERILAEGRARAIGVSNYMVRHLEELLARCNTPPAVNQIELSPFNYCSREDVIALCRDSNIVIEAYSPLTKAMRLEHPVLHGIARTHGKTPAQVLIRYALDKDTVVLPKSANRDRIRENAEVFDFRLTLQELRQLDGLNEGLATGWDPSNEP